MSVLKVIFASIVLATEMDHRQEESNQKDSDNPKMGSRPLPQAAKFEQTNPRQREDGGDNEATAPNVKWYLHKNKGKGKQTKQEGINPSLSLEPSPNGNDGAVESNQNHDGLDCARLRSS